MKETLLGSFRPAHVDPFRKRVAVVEPDGCTTATLGSQVATIAEEESLRAHALSARLRAD